MALYRDCRQETGRPPSGEEYDHWRLARRSRESGTNALPHSNTLRRRIGGGSWSGVAAAAGEVLPRSRTRRADYSTDEIAAMYQACRAAVGHDPSNGEFDAWRETRRRVDPTARIPAAWTFVRRLGAGSWPSIAEAVNPGAVVRPTPRLTLRYSAEGSRR
jgi:hypothetical protein